MRECKKCQDFLPDNHFYAKLVIKAKPELPFNICKCCFAMMRKRSTLEPSHELARLSKQFLRTHFLEPINWDMTLCK